MPVSLSGVASATTIALSPIFPFFSSFPFSVTVHAPEGPLQFVLERDDTTLHGRATNTRTFPVRIARAGGRLARKTNGGDGAHRRTGNRTGQSPQELFQLAETAIQLSRSPLKVEAGAETHLR